MSSTDRGVDTQLWTLRNTKLRDTSSALVCFADATYVGTCNLPQVRHNLLVSEFRFLVEGGGGRGTRYGGGGDSRRAWR